MLFYRRVDDRFLVIDVNRFNFVWLVYKKSTEVILPRSIFSRRLALVRRQLDYLTTAELDRRY